MNLPAATAGYRELIWRGASYRVRSERYEVAFGAIKARRREIEAYIRRDRDFGRSLLPVRLLPDTPEVPDYSGATAAARRRGA